MPNPSTTPSSPDGAAQAAHDPSLPHDRDESVGDQDGIEPGKAPHDRNRESMKQALRDTESNVEDTERLGIPTNVPSSGDNG